MANYFKALVNPQTLMGGAMIGAGVMMGPAGAPLVGAGIGTTVGGVSGSLEKQQAEKQRKAAISIEATKAKYAPFTGQQGDIGAAAATPIPNVFSRALQGGVAGALMGQQFGGASEGKAVPLEQRPIESFEGGDALNAATGGPAAGGVFQSVRTKPPSEIAGPQANTTRRTFHGGQSVWGTNQKPIYPF